MKITREDIDDIELVDRPDCGYWACVVTLKSGAVLDMCEIWSSGGYEGMEFSTLCDMSGPKKAYLT